MNIDYDFKKEQHPKIWNFKAGDVVRLCNNDLKEPDSSFYLILQQENRGTHVFNLTKNQKRIISCSIRCIHFPKVKLIIKAR